MVNINRAIERILPKVSKPTRYLGNEYNSIKKNKEKIKIHFCLAFPDVYEIGMSHLGIKILYHLLNNERDIYAERVFAPWPDFERNMREDKIPLFSLETKTPLIEFDFLGFTLQYEMSYTNILNMLDLANIPIFSQDRTKDHPFIIAGGPCAYNPEPLADIIDFFVIGEAEEVILEIMGLYREHKSKSRQDFLKRVAKVPGVYVPSFYNVVYNKDNTIKDILPNTEGLPRKINKRFIKDLDNVFYPTKFIVPFMKTVHDRAVLEIFRGCTRGCRFCQAGMIYRPVREKSLEHLKKLTRNIINATGYDEISLSSLSTSDYSDLEPLVKSLIDELEPQRVSLALPSLRVDAFSKDLAEKIQEIKKTGLTFAPEAGSQRLRNVINKKITREDLLSSVKDAFLSGYKKIKLYFMIGLPLETYEDLKGIAKLCKDVKDVYRKVNGHTHGLMINVSTSTFVPKPFTPFQWEKQITLEEIEKRQKILKKLLRDRHISYKWHEGKVSFLEAVLARGDRRLGKVLKEAHMLGCKFDGWDEYFSFENWMEAFSRANVDPKFYVYRERSIDEVLPWDIINAGIDKNFLIAELKKAKKGETTLDCRSGNCSGCGIRRLSGGEMCGV